MEIGTPESGIESPSGSIEHSRVKAAIWAGYKVREFCEELVPEWQAYLIAHYILDTKIQAVIQQDGERKRVNSNPGPTGGDTRGKANGPLPIPRQG